MENDIKIYLTIDTHTLMCTTEFKHITEIPNLPEDASNKTYTLQAVNGALAWTDVIGEINSILDNINGENI